MANKTGAGSLGRISRQRSGLPCCSRHRGCVSPFQPRPTTSSPTQGLHRTSEDERTVITACLGNLFSDLGLHNGRGVSKDRHAAYLIEARRTNLHPTGRIHLYADFLSLNFSLAFTRRTIHCGKFAGCNWVGRTIIMLSDPKMQVYDLA